MKNSQYKQNLYRKEKNRQKRIKRMSPEQQNRYAENLVNRSQRKSKIREKLIEILLSEENLAIEDIRKKLDNMNRNTFNYWVNVFEKEGWFKRRIIEGEGEEIRGQPKTLILNKKKIKEREQYSYRRWKSYEEGQLKSLLAEKILYEIDKQQSSEKQHQRLIELFKQFGKEGFGAKLIFLLYDDFIKINYNLSLTDKGKKALEKIKTI